MPNEERPDTALEQLLVLVAMRDPTLFHLIDMDELTRQLRPALQVLRFGGKVIGPAEAAVLDAMADLHMPEVKELFALGLDYPKIAAALEAENQRRQSRQQPPEKERE